MYCKYITEMIEFNCFLLTINLTVKCSYFIIFFKKKKANNCNFQCQMTLKHLYYFISSQANLFLKVFFIAEWGFKVTLQKKIVILSASLAKGIKRFWSILDLHFKTYEILAMRVHCVANIPKVWLNINSRLSEVLKLQQIANNVQPSVGNKHLSSCSKDIGQSSASKKHLYTL